MIMKLSFKNDLAAPVLLRSNQATGQPLQPGQDMEMTFSLTPDENDVAELVLVVEPG